jgi:tetratricopeptide (TPR) repeat protein
MAQYRSGALNFLLNKGNREVLSWLAGGVSTVMVGGWVVFTYMHGPAPVSRLEPSPPGQMGMLNNSGPISGGQFIVNNGVVNTGLAEEKHQELIALLQGKPQAARLVELANRQVQAVRLIDEGRPEVALQQIRAAERDLSALNGQGNDDTVRLLRGYFYKTAAQAAVGAGREAAARDYAEEASRIFASIDADSSGRISWDALAGALNGLGNTQALLGDYHSALANYRRATDRAPDYAYAWHDMLLAQLALAKQGKINVAAMQQALNRLKATAAGYPALDADRIADLSRAVDYYSAPSAPEIAKLKETP